VNRDINKTQEYSTSTYPYYELSYIMSKDKPCIETVFLSVVKKGKKSDKKFFIADSPFWIFSVFPEIVLSVLNNAPFNDTIEANLDVYEELTKLKKKNLVEICNLFLQVQDDGLGAIPFELIQKLKEYDETDKRYSGISN